MSTAHAIGLFSTSQLVAGCRVWERLPDGADYQPRGGTVIRVDDRVDEETGELERAFVVLVSERGQLRFLRLAMDDIDRETVQPPSPHSIRGLIRRMAGQVAKGNGLMTPEHLTYVATMHHLAGLL